MTPKQIAETVAIIQQISSENEKKAGRKQTEKQSPPLPSRGEKAMQLVIGLFLIAFAISVVWFYYPKIF